MSPKSALPKIKGVSNVRYSGRTKTFYFNLNNKDIELSYNEAVAVCSNQTLQKVINQF